MISPVGNKSSSVLATEDIAQRMSELVADPNRVLGLVAESLEAARSWY